MKNLDNLVLLLSKPEYFEYFFKKLDRPDFLDWLKSKIRAFNNIPEPMLIDDGQYTHFPTWWPGKYLIKVANKIPYKVFDVIKEVKTNNISAIADCARAVSEMPKAFICENSHEIIELYDKWLDCDYTGYISDNFITLFRKFLDFRCYDEACLLFNIVSKTKKSEDRGIQFRFELSYFEEIADKYLPQLIEKRPLDIVNIADRRFREALSYNGKDRKSLQSAYLRITIEDSAQTWRHNAKDLLFEVLRDSLDVTTKSQPEAAKKIVLRYLNEKNTIYEQLAIHTIRISEFNDLAIDILINKDNLHRPNIYHEFARLLQDKFVILNPKQKQQFVTWIIEGTKDINARWLLLVKNHLERDEDLKEFRFLLDEYEDEFLKIERPDLLFDSKIFVGPRSPLKKEQMERMTPEDFIDWARTQFPPPYDPFEGSPEGVSRMLEDVIRQKPEPYAKDAERFLDKGLWPTYLSGLLRGLENAIKDSKIFDIESVLKFIEDSLKFHPEPEAKYDYFEIGKYMWLRGAIASFVGALTRKDEFSLTQDIMDRTQRVLLKLIEKDEDPTTESEKQYGPEASNMDYVTYCMNSNRGQAMVALMHHALRRARMRPEEEKMKERGKGPFPPGERMDLYKEIFTKRLDLEPSPSVQSSYGQFLPYLFYLDQNWVRLMMTRGKLFPKSRERIRYREAHWQGYIGYNNFYNQIYRVLKGEYITAVDNLVAGKDKEERYSHYDERLARHLITAFWRRLEHIEDRQGILNKFFKVAPSELRSRAIWFVADALKEVIPTKESDEWQRAKGLWEDRVKRANDEELTNFARWLKYCPETLDDIVNLIKPIIPHLRYGRQAEDLLNYIRDNVESSTKNALYLLNEYLRMQDASRSVLFRQELIKEILTRGHNYRDKPEIAKEINIGVNILGHMGYYDFRNLLVE